MTRLKILYVEDEPDIRTIAKMAMQSIGGFEVTDFPNGFTAVAGAAQLQPDLIVLDVMMPSLTGPDTLIMLREIPSCAEAPVIFMTAKVQADEVKAYLALGALGVIPKPFDPMSLSNEILSLWQRHQQRKAAGG